MSTKKRRKDSKLWTLSAETQAHLYRLCSGTGGYAAARAWLLQEHAVEVKSDATFTAWWSKYPFSLPAATDFAASMEKEMGKLPELEGQAGKLARLGQVGFELMAIRMQDLDGHIALKKRRQKDSEIALQESKHSLALRQYEEKISAAKANLEKAKSKGGLSKETLALIEEQLRLL